MKIVLAVVVSVAAISAAQTMPAGKPLRDPLTAEETFAAAKLTSDEIKQITNVLETAAFDTPESWEQELRVRRVSLGSVPGLIVQGTEMLCGGTGNCQLFVFRRNGRDWLPLFKADSAPVVDSFSFGPGQNHGIPDLTVTANSSASASSRSTYRFDGQFYRSAAKPAARH